MRKFLKAVVTLAAVAMGMAVTAPAIPAVNTTFYFTGTCSDCKGTGTATLVLSNYTLGQTITNSNFVSLTYNGSNLLPGGFTITSSSPGLDVAGSITNIPGNNFVVIPATLNGQLTVFRSGLDGTWSVGVPVADQGNSSTWSNQAPSLTPAPSTGILMISGLLAVAAFTWRRRQAA